MHSVINSLKIKIVGLVAVIVIGAISIVSATFGVVSWAISVEGFWETVAVIMFGAPIALLLATWPIALGQALRAIADIGDAVAFEPARY